MEKKKISIIIPAFNEYANIDPIYKSICQICKDNSYIWRLIFVDDGSCDNSLEKFIEIASDDSRVTVLNLSRNFGKEIALSAGVEEALDSDAAICLDADLQHPPELIPKLISLWEKGNDVVVARRTRTVGKNLIRNFGAKLYYWFMSKVSSLQSYENLTDFGIYDSKVMSSFVRTTERNRVFRGLIDWMGYKRAYIEFEAPKRASGEETYSLRKLIGLAVHSITSFSLWPLKIIGYLGVIITLTSSCLLIFMIYDFFFNNQEFFTAISKVIVINTLLIGVVLIGLGLISVYIGRIHTEVINRPLYIVKEKINFKK